jgi:retron-type reverse transcriptase
MVKLCLVTFEEVVSMENLCAAWQEFLPGKRRKTDVLAFARSLGDEVAALHDDLLCGRYRHGPYVRFAVADPKPRIIHKATVRDRLLHHAVHRQLYPFFARTFIADSFSCQVGKGTHRAMDRFRRFAWQVSRNHTRTCWVLKGDVRKFFASIDHGILLGILRGRLADGRLVGLLDTIIRSHEAAPGKGLPLGNLTSQLFANAYLNEFDRFVKSRLGVSRYVRYADDFVILSESRDYLLGLLPQLRAFLSARLSLDLHPDKVFVRTLASGVDFLGWVHFPHHRVPRATTRRRAFARVAGEASPAMLTSYLGLFRHGDAFEVRRGLVNEGWIGGVGGEQ